MTRSRTLLLTMGLCALMLLVATDARATLVAYWSFDNVAGGSTPDLVGGNNATVVGNPVLSAGVFGNALDFDGNDYLTHAFKVNRSGPFTIAHWLRPQDIASRAGAIGYYESNGTGPNYNGFNAPSPNLEMHTGLARPADGTDTTNYPHLVGLPAAAARWWFILQDGNAGTPNQSGFNQLNMVGGAAVEDTWTHVALTKTAAGVFTLYENGIAVHTVDTVAQGITFTGIPTTTSHIGVHGDPFTPTTPARFWSGLMDDLAIYDTALSPQEIRGIMANGVPEPSSMVLLVAGGLVAFACRKRWRG